MNSEAKHLGNTLIGVAQAYSVRFQDIFVINHNTNLQRTRNEFPLFIIVNNFITEISNFTVKSCSAAAYAVCFI